MDMMYACSKNTEVQLKTKMTNMGVIFKALIPNLYFEIHTSNQASGSYDTEVIVSTTNRPLEARIIDLTFLIYTSR